MGTINTGGAKKRTGDNINNGISISGTTLKLTPPKGYYDGSTGRVTAQDADFIASNIKNGVNLFGLVGTSVITLALGSNTLASMPTSRTSQSGTFVKLKEVTIPYGGTINWSYQWKYTYGSQNGLFDVRINGNMIDRLERNVTSSVYNTRTGTATVNANDKVQLWFACSINGAGQGEVQFFTLTSDLTLPTVDLD